MVPVIGVSTLVYIVFAIGGLFLFRCKYKDCHWERQFYEEPLF
jgi:hypothetical protein